MEDDLDQIFEIVILHKLRRLDKGQSTSLLSAIYEMLRANHEFRDTAGAVLLESKTEVRHENTQAMREVIKGLFEPDFSKPFLEHVERNLSPSDGKGIDGTIEIKRIADTLAWNIRLSNAKARKDRISKDVLKVRKSIENLISAIRGDNTLMADEEFGKEWAVRLVQVLRTLAFELEQEFVGVEPVKEASTGMSWLRKHFAKAMNKATEKALDGAIAETGELLTELPEIVEIHRMLPEM